MDRESIKQNLETLKLNYKYPRLENLSVYNFGDSKGNKLFSILDPEFKRLVDEIKEDLGYSGNLYRFSDSATITGLIKEFDSFVEDVERIVNKHEKINEL